MEQSQRSLDQTIAYVDTLTKDVERQLEVAEGVLEDFEQANDIPLLDALKSSSSGSYGELRLQIDRFGELRNELERIEQSLAPYLAYTPGKEAPPQQMPFFELSVEQGGRLVNLTKMSSSLVKQVQQYQRMRQ